MMCHVIEFLFANFAYQDNDGYHIYLYRPRQIINPCKKHPFHWQRLKRREAIVTKATQCSWRSIIRNIKMEITGDLVKNLTDPSVVSICKQLLLETEPDDGRYYITAFIYMWMYSLNWSTRQWMAITLF